MKYYVNTMKTILPVLFLLTLFFRDCAQVAAQPEICAYLAGYGNWQLKDIQGGKLTQINYAFARIVDGKAALVHEYDTDNMALLAQLKARYPKLKINIAVGGNPATFHQAALTPDSRRVFCKSIITILKQYNLDGVDIDWEYPGAYGAGDNPKAYIQQDKENFTALLTEIRLYLEHLQPATGKRYQLSIAGAPGRSRLENIEGKEIAGIVDQVNIMTYDLHGGWDHQTAHHTNLDGKYGTPSGSINVKLAVQNYRDAGFANNQLVIGAAFYGRGWKKVYADDEGLYQMSEDPGGFECTYDELKHDYLGKNGFRRIWDRDASAAYLWNGSEFITYDDVQSVAAKADYVRNEKLRGIMFWEYSQNLDGELLDVMYKYLR